jgi:hypothetical protein
MTIPPETKDWTWVLSQRCPDCGFDTAGPDRADLAALASSIGDRWVVALAGIDAPGLRPEPLVWSPLEYACHVRDVFALGTYRTGLMVDEDLPTFANWDQDTTAVEEDYGSQDIGAVSAQLAANVAQYSECLAALPESAWSRAGQRSDGAGFTVESFTRYVLHDPIHHLTDITSRPWS